MVCNTCSFALLFVLASEGKLLGATASSASTSGTNMVQANDNQPLTVEVTLDEPLAKDPRLLAVVEELLNAEGVQMIAQPCGRITAAEFRNSPEPKRGNTVQVWAHAQGNGIVRLWFAAPGLGKYLNRDLTFDEGSYEVARE